jgi:putative spermidine/putrescine transport system ATP-binding protein/putrescine transport system ATP-binding protein
MKVVEIQDVTKRFGGVTAVDNISAEVRKGQIVSLLGPSGCGKTTTLRLVAGFERPDEGEILIAGKNMRGKRPYERNVGLLFQDYALFPHMTVEQNIAYGMRHRGMDHRKIPRRVAEMLELVKLTGFEKRPPSKLSGGEQQRVALARALATQPEVTLLDEPLSALDAKLRVELRVELKEILESVGSTTILVTHDQEEAMSLADHIIVMERGQVMQRGTPTEIYDSPQNKFVAEFIGRSNWFNGEFVRKVSAGIQEFETMEGITLRVHSQGGIEQRAFEVGIRPERITLMQASQGKTEKYDDVDRNVLSGIIANIQYLGSDIHFWIKLDSGKLVHAVTQNLGQGFEREGSPVNLMFKAADCFVVANGE